MAERSFTPEEARVSLQWTNHLLDAAPHDPALWLAKGIHFRHAMVDTIPRRPLLERVALCFQQCIREEPGNWVHHYNLAVTLRDLNRHGEALKRLERAVDLQPDNPRAQELLIQTLIRLGEYRKAKEAFERAGRSGCAINPRVLGVDGEGHQVSERSAESNPLPDQPLTKALYRNPDVALKSMLDGNAAFAIELSDPELFTLQCEVDELFNLGLLRAAEESCIHFELTHGENSVTRTSLLRLKAFGGTIGKPIAADISAAYPLLEIATCHLHHEYWGVVNHVFEEGRAGQYITPQEVNDFDEQIRWHLERLPSFRWSLNDPASAVRPIPPDLQRVWSMATLNFIVARRMNHPLLVAYTATTLASFYDRLGRSNLPLILYKTAAVNAEVAGQTDYLVNARGKCALILEERGLIGPAVHNLEKVLAYAGVITPRNRFHLYQELASLYSHLSDFGRSRHYYELALSVTGVPEDWLENVRLALAGLEVFANRTIQHTGFPPVQCTELELQSCDIELPHGPWTLFFTSRHELYDSLLQAVDNVYRVRQSLLEREAGYNYFQKCGELMEALTRTALELELPGNALRHLEAQKSLILNSRLRYLMRQKPPDLPDSLWDGLQRLVAVYRKMAERTEDSDGLLEEFSDLTLADVAEAIGTKLWECRQASAAGARQIQQKLGFDRFPERIECVDPEHTRILELCYGACFLIHPDDPQSPEAIALPEATPEACERLAAELFEIIEEMSQLDPLETPPSTERFEKFVERLDEVLYLPIASRLEACGAERLCIVPHRILHVLPLNLLGLSRHPLGSLGERFLVSFAPSLTSLVSLGGLARVPPARCLIVADPVPACPAGACQNPARDCFSLAGAQQEGRSLRSLLNELGVEASLLCGEEATVQAVTQELGSADIVHFATHGWFNAEQPKESGLLLSLSRQSTEARQGSYFLHDGSMTDRLEGSAVGEALTLDAVWKNIDMFSCQLLNLAACSTAFVDSTERTDEFYGLANGFLYAGAQTVLGNLWPVHDAASEIFNTAFYENFLVHRETALTAFKAAVKTLKGLGKPFSHPFFWAGYRVVGFE